MTSPRVPRKRDYAAERRRRNQLARERGFTSLDALAKARRQGAFPTARQIKSDPAKAAEAQEISKQRVPKLFGARDSKQLESWNRESKKWAKAHARQDGTRYDPQWPMEQRVDYYNAFVRWWMVPNDERNWNLVYDYMRTYGGFDDIKYDENPYQHKE